MNIHNDPTSANEQSSGKSEYHKYKYYKEKDCLMTSP